MHTLVEVRRLFTYNDWANDRLIAMLNRVVGEETDLTKLEDGRGLAIQQASAHLIGVQAIWRQRWEGQTATPLNPTEYLTPLALRMALGAERARFWGFFETLQSDAALSEPITYRSLQGEPSSEPLGELMQHVLLHSMYHRGQITARLIDMGHEEALLYTDYLVFFRENR